MNNFEERITEFTTLMANRNVCDEDLLVADYLINDLNAALQAKDAEIAELKLELRKTELDNKDLRHMVLNNEDEIAELRGLLGEAVKYVNAKCGCKTMQMMCFAPCQERLLSDRITAALKGGGRNNEEKRGHQ
jgi:hypothetical protein